MQSAMCVAMDDVLKAFKKAVPRNFTEDVMSICEEYLETPTLYAVPFTCWYLGLPNKDKNSHYMKTKTRWLGKYGFEHDNYLFLKGQMDDFEVTSIDDIGFQNNGKIKYLNLKNGNIIGFVRNGYWRFCEDEKRAFGMTGTYLTGPRVQFFKKTKKDHFSRAANIAVGKKTFSVVSDEEANENFRKTIEVPVDDEDDDHSHCDVEMEFVGNGSVDTPIEIL